jgi:transcription initiation factor TFIIH subunit 4
MQTSIDISHNFSRELPELAKHFVMRTLFAEQPLPETLVNAWVKKDQQK